MYTETFSSVLSCLLHEKSTDPIAAYAQKIGAMMCKKESAADRLEPIFARINGYDPGWSVPIVPLDGTFRVPQKDSVASGDAAAQRQQLDSVLSAQSWDEQHVNRLLDLLERYGGTIPTGAPGLSLYDERKISAALAACVADYTQNDPTMLDGSFADKKAFLLYTADFSGIQKFIYTVASAGALRSLRSRSLFLELTMEHYIDELLEGCGMNRVNLLYSGGGHCYVLLPNTAAVVEEIQLWNERFNDWLIKNFGVCLYLADGWCECSVNDLCNIPAEKAPYKAIFRKASSAVAKKKICRYSPEQLRRMNSYDESAGRECHVCGANSNLTETNKGETVCAWCNNFTVLANHITECEAFVIKDTNVESGFKLPSRNGTVAVMLCSVENAVREGMHPRFVRAYTKNCTLDTIPNSIRFSVADLITKAQMGDIIKASQGVERAAVCRMDVDSLGQTFVSGFERIEESDPNERYRYVTLARTSAFSRHISRFFKEYIKGILAGENGEEPLPSITIVYSGGDDVFLVGAWNEILDAALRVRNAFSAYTCKRLTVSAGISVFDYSYPIRLAASTAAELEELAKEHPGKNALVLFDTNGSHLYTWETYENKVIGEKLKVLTTFFYDESTTRGTSFLYSMLELLREAGQENGKISIARLAYLLAKAEPPEESDAQTAYKIFSEHIYDWVLDPEDRRQLITAILIFSYYKRKAG